MNYIRTKDGIYKVDAYDNAGTCIVGGFDNRKTFYKDEYLKMTDTIEELCDMTVVVDEEISDFIFELEYGIDQDLMAKYRDFESVIVYAAIWTSKGLIYVAKLQEDGKLVLI